MRTINDGVHYSRKARSDELDRVLQEIITRNHVDVVEFSRIYLARYGDWFGDPRAGHMKADLTITALENALQAETGCEISTARGHIAKWLRQFRKQL